jgi:acetyl coenzyme A synthetase (ADP forming)-like protein
VSERGRKSLYPIFSPRTIAVVGASRRQDSIGNKLLHNLIFNGFNGAIYPVNPKAQVVHCLKCYPSVSAIPDPIDLAILMVPRDAVLGALEESVARGVQGIIVITAGFKETGEEGAALEQRLRETVRAAGVRMIGPNCMGVINTEADVRLDATFSPTPALPGSLGFVSQSGALGVAILNFASDLGIGLSQFVSMGNKADVSGNDLLEFWEEDERTRVICMYLESFGNPRRFTEIAKRVGRKKPILVVKSGRTAEGARAASSHTGAMAGTDVTISAFLEQCGVVRANTIEELFDIARAFERCPLPSGDRVAIVTNAGGPGIMATDACVNLGLQMAPLTDATRRELASFLPPEASLENPVDMIASAKPEDYSRALRTVLADSSVDMVVVINVTPVLANPKDVLEATAPVATASKDKPVVCVMMATEEFYDEVKKRDDLPPVYHFPESAALALSRLHRHALWRRRPVEAISDFEVDDTAVATLLAETGEGHLPPKDAFRVLELYGIPTARWRVAGTPETALITAEEVGYPVALKAVAPDLVHKSDRGAVELGLPDSRALQASLEEMKERLAAEGHPPQGYLVQEMAEGGHEVIFGITTDPRFGPLLMFGLGGKYVEVIKDVRFGVAPLAPSEADDMIRGIRGYQILEGVRGEPPVDRELLREVLLRLAQLSQRHLTIQELDINPFLAAPDSASAKALDVRIRVGSAVAERPS